MTDLPLIVAGLVAIVAIVLGIFSSWAWLIVAAGAIAGGAIILWRRGQRA